MEVFADGRLLHRTICESVKEHLGNEYFEDMVALGHHLADETTALLAIPIMVYVRLCRQVDQRPGLLIHAVVAQAQNKGLAEDRLTEDAEELALALARLANSRQELVADLPAYEDVLNLKSTMGAHQLEMSKALEAVQELAPDFDIDSPDWLDALGGRVKGFQTVVEELRRAQENARTEQDAANRQFSEKQSKIAALEDRCKTLIESIETKESRIGEYRKQCEPGNEPQKLKKMLMELTSDHVNLVVPHAEQTRNRVETLDSCVSEEMRLVKQLEEVKSKLKRLLETSEGHWKHIGKLSAGVESYNNERRLLDNELKALELEGTSLSEAIAEAKTNEIELDREMSQVLKAKEEVEQNVRAIPSRVQKLREEEKEYSKQTLTWTRENEDEEENFLSDLSSMDRLGKEVEMNIGMYREAPSKLWAMGYERIELALVSALKSAESYLNFKR